MTEFLQSGKGEFSITAAHYEVWRQLQEKGYVVVSDENRDLGFDPGFREHLGDKFFNKPNVLMREHYPDVIPQDRDRARDVVRYVRDGLQVRLQENDTIAFRERSYDTGPGQIRVYNRILALEDLAFAAWIEAVLSLVPLDQRDTQSTLGINLLRTHSEVVNEVRPHQDDEKWVGILLRDKFCDGAETLLYAKDAYGEPMTSPIFGVTLEPGDFLFFDDNRYFHKATRLVPPLTHPTASPNDLFRDTIVCTVDKPETYLLSV